MVSKKKNRLTFRFWRCQCGIVCACVCVHDWHQIPESKSVRGGGPQPYLLTNYPQHKKHICSEISPISPRNVFDDKTNSFSRRSRHNFMRWGRIWFDGPTTFSIRESLIFDDMQLQRLNFRLLKPFFFQKWNFIVSADLFILVHCCTIFLSYLGCYDEKHGKRWKKQ